jgi:hypothetical protein
MQIELSIEDRSLIMRGLWKEIDSYVSMLNSTTDPELTKIFIEKINTLKGLEDRIVHANFARSK